MTSTSTSTPTTARFHTDVRRTRGLQAGQILARHNVTATDNVPSSSSASEEESRLNKKIDDHVRLLETSFSDLISTLSVQDKDLARLELESFMADYRADVMVRSVEGLSRLARGLRLSCLLMSGQGNEEQEERKRLEGEIDSDQTECARILQRVVGRRGEEVVRDEQPRDEQSEEHGLQEGEHSERSGQLEPLAQTEQPQAEQQQAQLEPLAQTEQPQAEQQQAQLEPLAQPEQPQAEQQIQHIEQQSVQPADSTQSQPSLSDHVQADHAQADHPQADQTQPPLSQAQPAPPSTITLDDSDEDDDMQEVA